MFSVVALLQLQLKTLRSSPSTYTARYSRKPRTESRLSKLTVGRRTDPEMHCTYTKTIPLQLQFVFAAFCKCTPPGTGEERTPRCMHLYLRAAVRFCSLPQVHTSGDTWRTDPAMHALIPACCGSFLQPSASAQQQLRRRRRNSSRRIIPCFENGFRLDVQSLKGVLRAIKPTASTIGTG